MTTTLADIPALMAQTDEIRENLARLRRMPPLVRLWTNQQDGSPGLTLRGRVPETVAGKFPWKNNKSQGGQLRLRLDHHLARWLTSIPDDPDAKKNVVLTVCAMGGAKRWSGLLKNWNVITKNRIHYLEVNFVDDLQFLQFMLGPPNPALPIPVFQFPRVLPIFGPAKWAVSMLILMNLIRLNGHPWTLPDDPFNVESWDDLFDWSDWQVFVKAKPFDLDDSSLWTILATRMNRIDQVVADALDDAQLTITYRRILTVDGETSPIDGVPDIANGALVFEVVDNSGYYGAAGTGTGGGIAAGLERSVAQFLSGFVEDYRVLVTDDETIWPDEYYQEHYHGTVPSAPHVTIRDSRYSQIETSQLTWAPATAVSVIVGGDNPLADNLARLTIESIAALIGYFLLAGFSGLGSIVADVVMPFLVGTIFAWLQWTNNTRAHNLGWVHLYEVFQQGAENNSWSLSAVAALRAGFESTKAQTAHQFTMRDGGEYLPGLDYDTGHRIASTASHVTDKLFVDQVEAMEIDWDFEAQKFFGWGTTVGKADAALSMAERSARLMTKALTTIQNIGVHLIS
ncbi:Gp37-like protein [Nocardia sp. NPDC004573]